MRNTSKPSPRDEVANRDEKFLAVESRGTPNESSRKHVKPFALSSVTSRFDSRFWLQMLLLVIQLCITAMLLLRGL